MTASLLSSDEEEFLFFILKNVNVSANPLLSIVDWDIVQKAKEQLLKHFDSEDKIACTNHVKIIKELLMEERTNSEVPLKEFGLSRNTYYRYKHKYLTVFKNNLIQLIKDKRELISPPYVYNYIEELK